MDCWINTCIADAGVSLCSQVHRIVEPFSLMDSFHSNSTRHLAKPNVVQEFHFSIFTVYLFAGLAIDLPPPPVKTHSLSAMPALLPYDKSLFL